MNMNPRDLIEFGQAFTGLGWSIQEQVADVIRNGNWAECNPAAIRQAKRALGAYHHELDELLGSWLANNGESDKSASTDAELRNRLIRLAAAKPELRADILPLIQEQADPASHDQNKPESYYGLQPRGVQAARRSDANRVVLMVTTAITGPMVVNVTHGINKKYPYDGTPEGLAATLQEAATSSIRFQSMDFLDGPELNVVQAPRVPSSVAQTVFSRTTVVVGPVYVALQGISSGLQWVILPRAPKFAAVGDSLPRAAKDALSKMLGSRMAIRRGGRPVLVKKIKWMGSTPSDLSDIAAQVNRLFFAGTGYMVEVFGPVQDHREVPNRDFSELNYVYQEYRIVPEAARTAATDRRA